MTGILTGKTAVAPGVVCALLIAWTTAFAARRIPTRPAPTTPAAAAEPKPLAELAS